MNKNYFLTGRQSYMSVVAFIVLFVSLIVASQTLLTEQTFSYEDLSCDYILADPCFGDRRSLEQYSSYTLQMSGFWNGEIYFSPVRSAKVWRRPAALQIRPATAQRRWERDRKHAYLSWPLHPHKFWISSYYGTRILKGKKGFHHGIDMAAPHGTGVTAAAAGRIEQACYLPGYGNCIIVRHGYGLKTRYAHLQKIQVRVGQDVQQGEQIGTVGATGNVAKSTWGTSASHLHFEVYFKENRVNPFSFLA